MRGYSPKEPGDFDASPEDHEDDGSFLWIVLLIVVKYVLWPVIRLYDGLCRIRKPRA